MKISTSLTRAARFALFGVALSGIAAATPTAQAVAAEEVNLYSYRQPFLIEPLLERFTAETGIKVNVVFANKGMLEKDSRPPAPTPPPTPC